MPSMCRPNIALLRQQQQQPANKLFAKILNELLPSRRNQTNLRTIFKKVSLVYWRHQASLVVTRTDSYVTFELTWIMPRANTRVEDALVEDVQRLVWS